jgi:hypothetical protein
MFSLLPAWTWALVGWFLAAIALGLMLGRWLRWNTGR